MSASLWTGSVIKASGGPYGKIPKDIGVKNVTAKILCQSHNNRLSEVDTFGIKAFEVLTSSIALANARKRLPRQAWMRQGLSLDGPGLERWFLKTAINVSYVVRADPKWVLPATEGRPPRQLVEMVFGTQPIDRPLGMYAVAAIGDEVVSNEEVICELLYDGESRLAGALFTFRGFRFLLNMRRAPVTGIAHSDTPGELLNPNAGYLYHIQRINSDVNGHRSHFIDFNWPNVKIDHFAP